MKRNNTIQMTRLICAFMVIAIHTFLFKEVSYYLNHITVNAFCRFAVPFFFMITGYFYEKKESSAYIKHYNIKIIKIFLLWALIYFPFDFIYRQLIVKDISFSKALNAYIHDSMFGGFNGAFYHLWYLIAVIVAFSLLNFISEVGFLNKKYIKILFLFLYILGLSGTSYHGMWERFNLGYIITSYERFFSTTRNGIFFGLPFVWLGYTIAKKDITVYSYKELIYKIIFSFLFLCTEITVLDLYKVPHFLFGYDMTIGLIFYSYYLFILILKDPIKKEIIKTDLSLNIYLTQGIFLTPISLLKLQRFSLNFVFVSSLSLFTAYIIKKVSCKK